MRKKLTFFFLLFTAVSFAQNADLKDFKKRIYTIFNKYPNQTDSSLLLLNNLLKSSEVKNDKVKKGHTLFIIGKVYCYQINNPAEAIKYFQEANTAGQEANDCPLQLVAETGLCAVYTILNKHKEMIEASKRAAALFENCHDFNVRVYIYTGLGLAYQDENDLRQAEYYLKKSASLIESKNDSVALDYKIWVYSSLVDFYKKSNNLYMIKFYGNKAIALNREVLVNSKSVDLITYDYIINTFSAMGELDSAIHYANRLALIPLEKISVPDIELMKKADLYLGNLYYKKQDFEKSNFHKNKYIEYLEKSTKELGIDKGEETIKTLEIKLALEQKQREVERANLINYAVAALIAALLIITGIIYYNTRKLRKINGYLKTQRQELVALNDIRTKMFSVLSHDLVSPLGALQNMVQMYHQGFFTEQDFKDYTLHLKDNINALLKTVKNVLDWSYTQLNGKEAFIEPLKIHQIIDDQMDLERENARQKNITLHNQVPEDFTVSADFNQMSLIVRNLIDNAIKYGKDGGEIQVNTSHNKEGKTIIFEDNGIGMSQEQVANLFIFNEKTKKTSKGMGLGLQMVADLLKANNCQVSVESKETEGTEFRLLFQK